MRRSKRTACQPHGNSAPLSGPERSREEILDGALAVRLDLPRAGAGEVHVRDNRAVGGRPLVPVLACPGEPAVLFLVEDVQRLVTELRELGAPSRAAAHRPVLEDRAD